jgi:hypothetical protein
MNTSSIYMCNRFWRVLITRYLSDLDRKARNNYHVTGKSLALLHDMYVLCSPLVLCCTHVSCPNLYCPLQYYTALYYAPHLSCAVHMCPVLTYTVLYYTVLRCTMLPTCPVLYTCVHYTILTYTFLS